MHEKRLTLLSLSEGEGGDNKIVLENPSDGHKKVQDYFFTRVAEQVIPNIEE